MFGQSLLSAFGIACTTDTDQLFPSTVQATTLATYQLNNATTSIPSNTYPGTASNITYTTGKFGNAAVFNGNQTFANASRILLPTGVDSFPMSVSCWIYIDVLATTNTGAVVFEGQQGMGINFTGANPTYLFTQSQNGTTGQKSSNNALTTNQWYHVVGIFNSSTSSDLYINGVSQNGGVGSTNDYITSDENALGSRDHYGYPGTFNGKIDQVRIFNTALPQAAITALYNETTTTATYPYVDYVGANPNSVAYYKMSDATDQLGNYNGTATNVNFNTEGKFGFAGAFNGSSSVITLPAAFSNTYEGSTTWSFSAWVNLGSSVTSKIIFSKYNSSVQVGGISIETDAAGKVNFFVANSSDQRQVNNGNTVLSTNTWHNIVVIWSSGTVSMYVDGNAETITNTSNTYTGSTIPTTTTSSTKSNRFGAITYSGGSTSYSDIKLDQVRIYDSALSASNVSTLYKEVECEPVAINALDQFNTVLYTGTNGNQSISSL